jgi:hypothetical protein
LQIVICFKQSIIISGKYDRTGKSFLKINNKRKGYEYYEKFINSKDYGYSYQINNIAYETSLYHYSLRNLEKAIKYMEITYDNSPNADKTYKLALFNAELSNTDNSLSYLSKLYDNYRYEYYRKKALKDISNFKNLLSNNKFKRWISGVRRIKIKPISAYSNDWELSGNDLFVAITNNKGSLLCTEVVDNKDYAKWFNEYVIFDYEIGEDIYLKLFDADVTENELLLKHTFKKITNNFGEQTLKNSSSKITLEIVETDMSSTLKTELFRIIKND